MLGLAHASFRREQQPKHQLVSHLSVSIQGKAGTKPKQVCHATPRRKEERKKGDYFNKEKEYSLVLRLVVHEHFVSQALCWVGTVWLDQQSLNAQDDLARRKRIESERASRHATMRARQRTKRKTVCEKVCVVHRIWPMVYAHRGTLSVSSTSKTKGARGRFTRTANGDRGRTKSGSVLTQHYVSGARTCLIVMDGFQDLSSSKIERQTVPEGKTFGWNNGGVNRHLGGLAGYSSGNV